MKYEIKTRKIKKFIFIIFVFYFLIECFHCNDPGFQNNDEPNTYPKSDKLLEEIRSSIYKRAQEMSKNSSIYKKSIKIGELPDSFPDVMVKKAKQMRLDKNNWKKIMLYPTAVWRMCLFPNFKINYLQWCDQKFALSKSKIKLKGTKLFSLKDLSIRMQE